jgi:hypothetical protein
MHLGFEDTDVWAFDKTWQIDSVYDQDRCCPLLEKLPPLLQVHETQMTNPQENGRLYTSSCFLPPSSLPLQTSTCNWTWPKAPSIFFITLIQNQNSRSSNTASRGLAHSLSRGKIGTFSLGWFINMPVFNTPFTLPGSTCRHILSYLDCFIKLWNTPNCMFNANHEWAHVQFTDRRISPYAANWWKGPRS